MRIFDIITQNCCQRHLLFVLKFNSFTMKTRLLETFFLATTPMTPPLPQSQPQQNPLPSLECLENTPKGVYPQFGACCVFPQVAVPHLLALF